MTEQEWLASSDAQKMIVFLCRRTDRRRRVSRLLTQPLVNRKVRLFFCARCREMWDQIADDRCRKAVVTAERFAEGLASSSLLGQARSASYHVASQPNCSAGESLAHWTTWPDVEMLALYQHSSWDEQLNELKQEEPDNDGDIADLENAIWRERAIQAPLLRDIFGPLPFRPVIVNPAWLTSTVVSLATAIYEDRAFDRLPILADALEDAGCDNADILNHCRSEGPHVRGCWALDLVLAKK